LARADEVEAERLDERALADARDARDPDPDGVSGVGQEPLEEALGRLLVVGARALDERDRLREHPSVAVADGARERLDVAHDVVEVTVEAVIQGSRRWSPTRMHTICEDRPGRYFSPERPPDRAVRDAANRPSAATSSLLRRIAFRLRRPVGYIS